jgi:hypothetical protein
MQEITRLKDKFASSSKGAMEEDQGFPFVRKYKMNLLPKVARTKTQWQDILKDQDKRPEFIQDPLYWSQG